MSLVIYKVSFKPKSQVAMVTSRCLVERDRQGLSEVYAMGIQKTTIFFGAAKVIPCTGVVYRSFHGAKERFDRLVVSQQGASPIDILMTSRTVGFPLFARRRRKVRVYGFDSPPKSARFCVLCKIVA
jgi:hypothetical protein